jgi:hypothetical protein
MYLLLYTIAPGLEKAESGKLRPGEERKEIA